MPENGTPNRFDISDAITPIIPSTLAWNRLKSEYGKQRAFVIDGVLREREIMGLVAATKMGKSFLALDLAMSLATSRNWLKSFDIPVEKKVLFIDGELRPDTMFDRLERIQYHRQYDTELLNENLQIELLRRRGDSFDIRQLRREYFPGFKRENIGFVILDCLYKFLPADWSENDHSNMAQFVEYCDQIANMLDCCVCVIHHSSKGAQGSKNQTDIGSGAGTFQRAVDTLLTIRPHEKDDYSVMETSSRSMRAIEPVSMFYTWPCWNIDHMEQPLIKSPESAATRKKKTEDEHSLNKICDLDEFTIKDIRNHLAIGHDKANRLRLLAEEKGLIEEVGMQKRKHSNRETMVWKTVKTTGTETGMKTGMETGTK